MKKTSFFIAILLLFSFSISAQEDGVTYKKVNPSESLREYEIAYFGDKPVIAHNIKPLYVDLHFMHHIFQQEFMTVDSLLGSNDIANKQNWYMGTRRRQANGETEREKELIIGYEFDQQLRRFLTVNFSPDLLQRFAAWGGSNDQFAIKKAYSDFLSSKTLENIQKDLRSFEMPDDLLYLGYGAIGNYDFNTKELQFFIQNLRYIKFPETINKNHGSSLECLIKLSEEEAQAMKEKKFFRALIPVKPKELEVSTINQFLKETISERYLMMELNGDQIELIGNLNAQEKIMTIDVNTCRTR